MAVLIQCALVVPLHLQYMSKPRTDLDLSFSVEEDLGAADVVVRDSLVMEKVERPQNLLCKVLQDAFRKCSKR